MTEKQLKSQLGDPEPDAVQVDITSRGITTITIGRPSRRNAVNSATAKKLRAAFLAFENDPSQKVCVFAGSGGDFCAGADLHEVAQLAMSRSADTKRSNPEIESHSYARVKGRNLAPMGPSRMQILKPVIAAISGHAVAGGLELSLLADIRVVEEDAVMGVFCRRFGVPLIDGGTVRLQRIVGLGRALDIILTGRPIGANEALQMGLANRVVPKGKALEEAQKIAEQLLAFPQECMNVDRANAYYAAYDARSFEDAMAREFDEGMKVVSTESIEGAVRFSKGEGRHGRFNEQSRRHSKL
jgi:enoyl-CoA hydratase/carnithine racemase